MTARVAHLTAMVDDNNAENERKLKAVEEDVARLARRNEVLLYISDYIIMVHHCACAYRNLLYW